MDILHKTVSIQPEHTGTFLRLKKLVSHSKGFQLLIIDYNIVSYRDFIIQSLNNQNYDTNIIDSLQSKDFFDLEQKLTHTTSTHNKIVSHIINLETNTQANTFYTGFNYHRERIANDYPHTLILWLSQTAIQQLSEQAIDFWSWREQVFNFFIELDIKENAFTLIPNKLITPNFDLSKKQLRKQEILDFLTNHRDISHKLTIDIYQELAFIEMLLGLHDNSLQYLEKAKKISEIMDDKLSYYLLMRDEARLLYLKGNYQEALKLLKEKILPTFELLNIPLEIANTQHRIVEILITMGEYNTAFDILSNKMLPIYTELQDIQGIAVSNLQIADILKHQNKYNEALDLLTHQILPIYQNLNAKREIAATKGQIATILTHQGFYDKALDIRHNEELPIYQELGEIRSIAIIKGKIADILMLRGDFQTSLQIRLEEIPIYEQLGDIRELAIAQGKIADIYMSYGKYHEALKLTVEQEIPIYTQLGDLHSLTIAKARVVDIQIIQAEYQTALETLNNEIFPNYNKLNNILGIAHTKGQIAKILTRLKQYNKALLIRINEELPIYKQINEQNDIAITYLEIAELYYYQKKYDNAINIYEKQAIPLLNKLGDLAALTNAKLQLAFAYLKRNPNRSKKKVQDLLRWCYKTAQELHLPNLETIKETMLRVGIVP